MKKWFTESKPGDRFMNAYFSDGQLCSTFFEIVEDTPELRQEHDCPDDAKLARGYEEDGEGLISVLCPEDCVVPLTAEEWERLRAAGWPDLAAEALLVLADPSPVVVEIVLMRTKLRHMPHEAARV